MPAQFEPWFAEALQLADDYDKAMLYSAGDAVRETLKIYVRRERSD